MNTHERVALESLLHRSRKINDWVKRRDVLTDPCIPIGRLLHRFWSHLTPGEKILVAARSDCPLAYIKKITRWHKDVKFDVDINAPVKGWAQRRLKTERKRRKAGL